MALRSWVGSLTYVWSMLKDILTQAMAKLNLIADASLLLQHKFILRQQCVTQVPTFYVWVIPDVSPMLGAWDAALICCMGALVGINLVPGLFQAQVAHLLARLSSLSLQAICETAP